MLAQGLMATPQLRDQILGTKTMPLKTATHRQPAQRNRCSCNLLKRAIKVLFTPRCGMNLNRIRLQLGQQKGEVVEPHSMIGGFNQAKGAGRQTAPTAVATVGVDTRTGMNGISRADPLAGARAIRRATGRVKDSLTKMGIASIADADHQPRGVASAFPSPAESGASSMDDGSVGCHVDTLNAGNGIKGTKVCNRSQVLITGPTDQFDPTPVPEGFITGGL